MEGKLHLEIDKTVTPVINPPRRVPFALKEKLKSELDRLEGLEMIREVKEPTDWMSSLVVVEKPNGKLRATLPKILISNFHAEIDFVHNSSINFTWQVGNKYEIISEKLNFFKTFWSELLASWNVLQT